jgi:hypothetical protein
MSGPAVGGLQLTPEEAADSVLDGAGVGVAP